MSEIDTDLTPFANSETLRVARQQGAAEMLGKLIGFLHVSSNSHGIHLWALNELKQIREEDENPSQLRITPA